MQERLQDGAVSKAVLLADFCREGVSKGPRATGGLVSWHTLCNWAANYFQGLEASLPLVLEDGIHRGLKRQIKITLADKTAKEYPEARTVGVHGGQICRGVRKGWGLGPGVGGKGSRGQAGGCCLEDKKASFMSKGCEIMRKG